MIVLKYELEGRVPSKKNSKRIFRKRGKTFVLPSKLHEKWHKVCMAEIQLIGIPNVPIERVQLCKCIIYYPDHYRADNTNKVESVHDLLVDAKIIADDNFKVMPNTLQNGKYRKNLGGFEIYLTIDPKHPDNKDLDLDTLPIVEKLS